MSSWPGPSPAPSSPEPDPSRSRGRGAWVARGGRRGGGGGAAGGVVTRGRGAGRGRGRVVRSLDYGIPIDQSGSSSSAGPSLSTELLKVKRAKAAEKKHIQRLSAEERARLASLREAKQIGRFMMPDAPQSKRKKKGRSSPERGPCPLVPGTPAVPPARVRQPWEEDDEEPNRTGPAVQELPSVQEDDEPGQNTAQVQPRVQTPPPLITISGPLRRKDDEPGQSVAQVQSRIQERPTVQEGAEGPKEVETAVDVEMSGTSSPPPPPAKKLRVLTPSSTLRAVQTKLSATSSFTTIHMAGFASPTPSTSFTPSDSPQTALSKIGRRLDAAGDEAFEVDFLGFTPASSARASPSNVAPLLSSSPHPAEEQAPSSSGFQRPERTRHYNVLQDTAAIESMLFDSGSEEEDLDGDYLDDEAVPLNLPRDASNYPTNSDDLPEAVAAQLEQMDQEDAAALRAIADADMVQFDWSNDPSTFTGVKEVFTGEAGPTFSTEGLTYLDIFEKFFDSPLIDQMVVQTNLYADKLLSSNAPKITRLKKSWKPVTKDDIWRFLGVLMLQSLIPNPVEMEYWYPKSPFLKTGDFKSIMPYHIFILMKKCLHFVDNSTITHLRGVEKKVAKIQSVVDYLNEKFSSLYLPEQTVAIDESLLLWKGRLSFAQLISNKAAQVGIKTYELCESRTGYMWKMKLYSGKNSGNNDAQQDLNEPQNSTSQTVLNLMRPLLNKGHVLVMDNFYNSPLLSRILKAQKTDTMGTLRINREFVPDSLKGRTKTNFQQGEVAYSHTNDLTVVVWRDTNIVSLISTFHNVQVGGTEKHGRYKYKPQVVLDYNLSMGGVDKKDQLLEAFPIERKRNKIWYKKVFKRLLNVSIHNSFVIARHSNATLKHREYRRDLTMQIINKYKIPISESIPVIQDATLGHFPVQVQRKRNRCKQCEKTKKETRTTWSCEKCKVGLCVGSCFKAYHLAIGNPNQ